MTNLVLNQRVFIGYLSTFNGVTMHKSVLGTVTKVTKDWYQVSYGMHSQWVKKDGIRQIQIF